jgi:hypothetical protein
MKPLLLYNIKKTGRAVNKMKQTSGTLRRKRKRRRQIRKLILTGLAGVLGGIFLFVCWNTNWFKDLPARNKNEELEQIMAKQDYPDELRKLLEENEESYDFVENYAKRDAYIGKPIDLSNDYQSGTVPLFMQWDKRWGYDLYGDSMIGLAGCGPTCMTMAYIYYTGDLEMNPRKMSELAQEKGYHTQEGTSWSFWTAGAADLGMRGETVSLDENVMKSVLDSGGLLILSMSAGDFTTGGHYILIRGYDENGFYVNDPNRRKNSEKQWDFETLQTQIKNLWAIYV